MKIDISEEWLKTPSGVVFVRRWRPARSKGKPSIVLFHDSLGCVALWKDFPLQIAQATGLDTIAFDRLGFGLSSPLDEIVTPDFVQTEATRSFAPLVEALNLDRVILIGHSVGGALAASCAYEFPHHCAGLITLSAQAFTDPVTVAGVRAAKVRFTDPKLRSRLDRYHGERTTWVLNRWFGTWLNPAFSNWQLVDTVPFLRCPFLVIHGTEDEYGSLEQPKQMAILSADSATLFIEHCGHFPHREHPEAVLNALSAFIDGRQ